MRTAQNDLFARRLQLLFTPDLCRRGSDPWSVLELAVAGGVDLVQWRIKDAAVDGPDLERCASLCRRLGVPLLVNDDVDAAVRVDAAGAHVGQDDLPAELARRRLGADRWLGVSTHTVDQIHTAVNAGADYLGFGPMFATTTKGYVADQAQPSGALRDAIAAADGVPVFAIGGLDAQRVAELRRREGLDRVAVSSAILDSPDPRASAEALRRVLANTT